MNFPLTYFHKYIVFPKIISRSYNNQLNGIIARSLSEQQSSKHNVPFIEQKYVNH